MEIVQHIVHFGIIIGVALFFWSVANSLEKIAAALSRLADNSRKENVNS
jgi:hypothetical protein